MAREIAGDYAPSRVSIWTKDEDDRIGVGRLSLQVVSEGGRRGQMPLSQDQALELSIALVETVRELANRS